MRKDQFRMSTVLVRKGSERAPRGKKLFTIKRDGPLYILGPVNRKEMK